jgi:hypothetical protein
MSRSRRGVRVVVVFAVWMVLGVAGAGAETGRAVVVLEPAVAIWQKVAAQLRRFLARGPGVKAETTEGAGGAGAAPPTAGPSSEPSTEGGHLIDPLG